jgi:hypothetical protein
MRGCREMDRTQGRGDGERRGAERDVDRDVAAGGGQEERQRTAEREAGDHASGTGYRPSANQRRNEPMPASHHDDLRQEAVVRNEEQEHASGGEQAQPSPRAPSRRTGRRDRG